MFDLEIVKAVLLCVAMLFATSAYLLAHKNKKQIEALNEALNEKKGA